MIGALWESITRPNEIAAMLKVMYQSSSTKTSSKPLDILARELNDIDYCYAVLQKVSRSFAMVIQQLTPELRDAICIFYLVLRGLDSVEDDMDYPLEKKLPLLRDFNLKLEIDGWSIVNVGDSPDYRLLLADFGKVIAVYKSLKPEYRAVISDITKRMADGMADFAEAGAKSGSGAVATVKEYNLYCHYVAGLVGIGLSNLFSASGLEAASLRHEQELSNNMGLFLQKTNIIRDYLEDYQQSRTWWPKEIWGQYASSLDWFAQNPDHPKSRACLNHMVTDAFSLVPDCLKYLAQLHDPSVFVFCAIPQIMAMGTLAKVYDNTDVFKKVVKIRKGLVCDMMLNCHDFSVVKGYFLTFAKDILQRIDATIADDNEASELAKQTADKTRQLVSQIELLTEDAVVREEGGLVSLSAVSGIAAVATAYFFWTRA